MGIFDGISSVAKEVPRRGWHEEAWRGRNLVFWGTSAFLTLCSYTVPSKSFSLQAEGALSSALTLMRILFGRDVEKRTWSTEETGRQRLDPSLSMCLCIQHKHLLSWSRINSEVSCSNIGQSPHPFFSVSESACLSLIVPGGLSTISSSQALGNCIGLTQNWLLQIAADEVYRKITQVPFDISRLIVTKEIRSQKSRVALSNLTLVMIWRSWHNLVPFETFISENQIPQTRSYVDLMLPEYCHFGWCKSH